MTPFSDSLAAGIAQMRLNISPAQQQKLLAYLALLQKWNKTYNLTALRDPAQMVSHHLLDSLTLLPYLAQAESMIDVGSGGGMPAIPAAICRPDLQITMVDANSKKTTFLRQAAIELGLENIAVSSSRVEEARAAADRQRESVGRAARRHRYQPRLCRAGGFRAPHPPSAERQRALGGDEGCVSRR